MKGFKSKSQKSTKKSTKLISQNKSIQNSSHYYSQAITSFQQGDILSAETNCKLALESYPKNSSSMHLLGSIYIKSERPKEASQTYIKAIDNDPNDASAYLGLGHSYLILGYHSEAIQATMEALEIEPDSELAIELLKACLSPLPTIRINKTTEKAFDTLLDRKDFWHQALGYIFTQIYRLKIKQPVEQYGENLLDSKTVKSLSNDSRFKKAITLIIPAERDFELFLTALRKSILIESFNNKSIPKELKSLTEALATQCLLNEFAYQESESETKLIRSILESVSQKKSPLVDYLAIIGCYVPLHEFTISQEELNQYPKYTYESVTMLQTHINEPRKLEEIKTTLLSCDSTIENNPDRVSKEVSTMYNENPYPRYRFTSFTPALFSRPAKEIILSECTKKDLLFDDRWTHNEFQPKILIAGCGTGKQVLDASRYSNAQITAIDFSHASLAYASLKSKEYGLNNVELKTMNILEIDTLGIDFDIIECSGVLHHMENPKQGLLRLTQSLKAGGFIKLGLYSEIARKPIIKARDYIKKKGFSNDITGIRKFRNHVLNRESPDLAPLLEMAGMDLFSISMCRDLCFHVKEHRFTIRQIYNLLQDANLIFCGFNLFTYNSQCDFQNAYPGDKDMITRENWEQFEINNPSTFSGMYQFWAQKPIKPF
ncbi:methyltransferase [Synechococcus sp. MIT S9452]|uniref:methyltransferase n=1 Tax=Synechococcus sp. MIT S9452 TaxID=3082546 RepID=UPI0039A77A3F